MQGRADREPGWIEATSSAALEAVRWWIEPAVWLVLAVAAGLAAHWIVFQLLARVVRSTRWTWDEGVVRHLRRPSRLVFPLLAVQFALPGIGTLAQSQVLGHALSLLTIGSVVWLVLAVIRALSDEMRRRRRLDAPDASAARALHTQITVVARTLGVFTILIGLAAALTTFPRIRQFGTSLLASAGIAGLAVGLAARPVLENLIAGIQLALTQPIRIGDSVVLEGEQGTIEEITGTFVVVRIRDGRRLIAPLSRFLLQPFQNWTRTSTAMIGSVTLFADYTVPVAAVRDELRRIVEMSSLWDRGVCELEVTDANERQVKLRANVSSADPGANRELCAHVREKLIDFLQREHPSVLPAPRPDRSPAPSARSAPPAA